MLDSCFSLDMKNLDIHWVGFDKIGTNIVYGVRSKEDEPTYFSVFKCNVITRKVIKCKTVQIGIKTENSNIKQVIRIKHTFSDDASYLGIYRVAETFDDGLLCTFIRFDCQSGQFSQFRRSCKESSNRMPNYEMIRVELYNSCTLGWIISEWWQEKFGVFQEFYLYRIVTNEKENSFETVPLSKVKDQLKDISSHCPDRCFLLGDLCYFTFLDEPLFIFSVDHAGTFMRKISTKRCNGCCRDLFNTDQGLLGVFNGRRPFFNFKKESGTWEQLDLLIPPHEIFFTWLFGRTGEIFLTVPDRTGKSCNVFAGRFNNRVPTLQDLSFSALVSNFEGLISERKFLSTLNFSKFLKRKFFGPDWTLRI